MHVAETWTPPPPPGPPSFVRRLQTVDVDEWDKLSWPRKKKLFSLVLIMNFNKRLFPARRNYCINDGQNAQSPSEYQQLFFFELICVSEHSAVFYVCANKTRILWLSGGKAPSLLPRLFYQFFTCFLTNLSVYSSMLVSKVFRILFSLSLKTPRYIYYIICARILFKKGKDLLCV